MCVRPAPERQSGGQAARCWAAYGPLPRQQEDWSSVPVAISSFDDIQSP